MSGGNASEPLPPESETRTGARLLPPLSFSNLNNNLTVGLGHPRSERLILVRDPPREHLARARSSPEPEETLLARIEGKQYSYRHTTTTTTSTTNFDIPTSAASSPAVTEEFYTDLYQYYYDVTKPPSNEIPLPSTGRVKPKSKPKLKSESYAKINATATRGKHEGNCAEDTERESGSDTERDEERDSASVMSKKRGSLQAIFVPSFLQASAHTELAASPPSSPTTTTTKYVQRLRALSAVAQPPSPSPSHHTTFSSISSGENGGLPAAGAEGGEAPKAVHQRKRSTTFSLMTSFSSSNSNFITSPVPSPTTPIATTHSTIHSPRSSPPPAFLLDDDPFANLTFAPSESMVIRSQHHPSDASSSLSPVQVQVQLPPPVHPIPHSPLNETAPLLLSSVGSVVAGGAAGEGGVGAMTSPTTTLSSVLPLPTVPTTIPAPILPSSPSTLSNTVLSNSNVAPIIMPSTSISTTTSTSMTKPKPKSAPSSPPASASASTSFFPGSHPFLHTHTHPYPQPPPPPRALPLRAQPRPAHQRPAFSARPSLPSLDTLARMNVVLTKKVRKGRVGAGLPFEPWDLPSDDESLPTPPPPLSAAASSSNSTRSSSHNLGASRNGNSNAELNSNDDLNANVNANNDVHLVSSSTSTTTSISTPMSTSTSMPSSPIPIPLSSSSSSSYIDFDSDSGSSSNSTTPTSSLTTTNSYPRPRPPSPSPSHMHTHIIRPQPLLPSQIMALGSVAADVEMIVPVGNGNGGGGSDFAWSRSEARSYSPSQHHHHHQQSRSPRMAIPSATNTAALSNWNQNTTWSSAPAPTLAPLSVQSSMNGPSDFVSELQPFSSPYEVDGDGEVEIQAGHKEDEEQDEYFEDLLDRYQMPSRGGSEDGHGSEQEVEVERGIEVVAEVEVERRIGVEAGTEVEMSSQWELESEGRRGVRMDEGLGVLEEKEETEDGTGGTGVAFESKPTHETQEIHGGTAEGGSFAAEYSYPYAHGSGEGDPDAEVEPSPGLTRSDSVFSSPPSSASLSRSFSMRSDSSIGSADSGGAVEHPGGRNRREEMWSFGRFADPSQSLSSLELDLEREREEEGQDGLFDVDVTSIARERGDSTRSSSSRPSLSRTRSSSDDSDALQSPTPGDYDYSYFPYSHARTFARFFQPGYSTLFAPPAASEEDGPSFLPDPDRLNLSSSSSIDDLGGEEEAEVRGKPFDAENIGVTMAGGLAADSNGEGGFGFGFDKVLIAAEECQQDDVEKEKESLTNTTSIAAVRTTSTITREADQPSISSSDHGLPVLASSSSPSFNPKIAPLDPKSVTQTTDSPGTLLDDEMFTRLRMTTSNNSQPRTRTTTMNPRIPSSAAEPIDSSVYQRRGYSSTSSNSQPYSAGSSHEIGNNNSSGSNYLSKGSRDNRGGRRRGNGDDEDGEEDERRRRRALERMYADDGVIKKVASTSSSEDDGADNYGEASKSASKTHLAPWTTTGSRSPSISGSFVTASSKSPSPKPMNFPASSTHSSRYVTEDEHEEDEDDDDDVPLAQRIPGALTAQKTMRRQFREEREQRKKEKAERMQSGDAKRRARQETLRPAGAGVISQDGTGVVPDSSSHDAAMLATSAMHGQRRQRTLTLPGKSPISPSSPFNPHDLARKLQNVQMAEVSSPTYQQQYHHVQQYQELQVALSPTHLRSKSISRTSAEHQQLLSPSYTAAPPLPTSPATRTRSIKDPSSPYRQLPATSPISPGHAPPSGTLRPMRSFHRPSERRPMDDPRAALATDPDQRLGRSSTSATRNPHRRSPSQSRTNGDRPERITESVPPLPVNLNVRLSNDDSRKPIKPEARVTSARTSGDVDHPTRVGIAQQPMPGLVNVNKVVVSQQRIFVGNLQQFHMVEIGPTTTAGDVVAMMEAEGALSGWAGTGGWMVFEIAQDFGMERPVRSYELLADVQASWLKDKSVNFFVLKLTPLAAPLSRNAIPSSSPTHSAYIEWEAKRGKWSKRWLQLREHNLYLSKRDNGKDEILICSLSNFDAYQITRTHRAPKPFAFAIKSTDNLSFFENTADYLHTFSCSEKDGKIWMEKILVARSYVLHQERHILFSPKTTGNASAAVARSGTKKYAAVRPTHQPLVSLPPLGVAQSLPHHDVFEPGSLLAKHI